MNAPTEHVAASDVRTQTLSAVVEAPPVGTPTVLERVGASRSAVYEALADLEDRGCAHEAESGWRPTGVGEAVVDALSLTERVDEALTAAPEYWRTHTTEPLPQRFRQQLGALADAETMCAPDADPGRTVRAVAEHIRGAERVDVLAPVYHHEYGGAVAESDGDVRMVLAPSVLTDVDLAAQSASDVAGTGIRIGPVGVGLAVSDEALYLSTPALDGDYDARTELVAESAAAVAWGRRLFETHWDDADPPERVTSS